MYFWKTLALSDDIKNDALTENDWKQYYLAGSIFVSISMYLVTLTPRSDTSILLVEAIATVGVLIFGINITFDTNQEGGSSNYVARITALSFPLLVKIFLLSLLVGVMLGIAGELSSLPAAFLEWSISIFTIMIQMVYFWRLNEHLRYINS